MAASYFFAHVKFYPIRIISDTIGTFIRISGMISVWKYTLIIQTKILTIISKYCVIFNYNEFYINCIVKIKS